MKLNKILMTSMAVAGLSIGATAAHASLTISSTIGGGADPAALKWDIDSSQPVWISILSKNGLANDVFGSVAGQYAAPYMSGANDVGFTDQADGPDTGRYLTTGNTGSTPPSDIDITFAPQMNYLGLLWGSVDPVNKQDNRIVFYNYGSKVGEVSGSDIIAATLNIVPGDRGIKGTTYVNITGLVFNRAVFTSQQNAFEFDNLAVKPVPLPAAVWLFGSALVGLAGVGRRKLVGTRT